MYKRMFSLFFCSSKIASKEVAGGHGMASCLLGEFVILQFVKHLRLVPCLWESEMTFFIWMVIILMLIF
jgi:hypothetical protein